MNGVLLRLVRGTGWLLISAGAVVLLYLVYSLFFTGLTTGGAQSDLGRQWDLEVPNAAGNLGEDSGGASTRPISDVKPGDAMAVLQFRRPGSNAPLVHAKPLFVVEGVGYDELTKGPGHYPGTAQPGQKGNFAIAGHRTTYANPFFHLDDVQPGDEVHVTDRRGRRFVYKVARQQIVSPGDTWVIGPDPLKRGKRTLTLTTCHPRFSNAQRLIVFAELV